MPKRKSKIAPEEYCSIAPDFPKDGFIIILLLFNIEDNKVMGILPLSSIFTHPDQVENTVMDLLQNGKNKELTVLTNAILIPIKFHSLYPLERKYWENPTIHFDTWDRVKLFIPVLEQPAFYHLLVTPSSIEKEQTILHATLPLTNPDDTETIKKFMLTSDLPVDERANSAAIYSLGNSIKFNWQTKEVEKIEKNSGSN